ncbi:MAG: hypothetical protein HQL34_13530, partial [Alphaproteobacteria bacterium]|nr:hypothetical protein [Alphaproteobacteria bacterium]
MNRLACSVLLAGAVLAGGGEVRAAESSAVGLVLRAGGAVTPAVSAYSEVADGTRLTLGPGAQLTLLHYESCRQMTLADGQVTVSRKEVTLSNGARIDKEIPNKCPPELRVKPTGVAGGVRMRALDLGAPPVLPAVPDCLLVGPHADRFTGARISGGGAQVSLAVAKNRLSWPKKQPPLKEGVSYTITLDPLPGGKPYKAAFTAGPKTGGGDVCLLR